MHRFCENVFEITELKRASLVGSVLVLLLGPVVCSALPEPEPGVDAALADELRVGPRLGDPAFGDDEDLVGVLDGAQPVRDGDRSAALLSFVQSLLDDLKARYK